MKTEFIRLTILSLALTFLRAPGPVHAQRFAAYPTGDDSASSLGQFRAARPAPRPDTRNELEPVTTTSLDSTGPALARTPAPPGAAARPPRLGIRRLGGPPPSLAIAWPSAPPGFGVCVKTNLAPGSTWQPVVASVAEPNGLDSVIVPGDAAAGFFALQRP